MNEYISKGVLSQYNKYIGKVVLVSSAEPMLLNQIGKILLSLMT